MRRVVIVQARFASTRLPGKVMLTLGSTSVLQEVLQRCRAIPTVDAVCCAISDGMGADMLAAEAAETGASVFIGSEQDVLARYLGAAEAMQADEILRVTSDCPLIDPDLCANVLNVRAAAGADYASNNFEPCFPHGLDCEAFSRAALEASAREAVSSYDREHVTPFMRGSDRFRKTHHAIPDRRFAPMRWTLDYPEDYAFFHAVFRRLKGTRPPWRVLAEELAGTELPEINAMHMVAHANLNSHASGDNPP